MDTSDFGTDDVSVEKLRTELSEKRLKRIALVRRRFRNMMLGLVVISSAIIFVPKISKHIDERDKWNSEHSPSIAIIFEKDVYLDGVASIKKLDKPYYQCACDACRFQNNINDEWKSQEIFVVTEAVQGILYKTDLRYQRLYIGYKKGCNFDSYDVASNNFVNW